MAVSSTCVGESIWHKLPSIGLVIVIVGGVLLIEMLSAADAVALPTSVTVSVVVKLCDPVPLKVWLGFAVVECSDPSPKSQS